jgi:hypothetical protein
MGVDIEMTLKDSDIDKFYEDTIEKLEKKDGKVTFRGKEETHTKKPQLSMEEWKSGLGERYQKLKQTINDKLPDVWEPLEFTLSILMVLNIKGNTLPFAGIILGPPSSFKTVGIETLRTWPTTYYSDGFTPKSFVSHNTAVKREELAKIDLLPKIKNKALLAPELSPTFTRREEDLIEILGILTRILDGHGYESDSGAHGHRGYNGNYMFVMIGAAVDIPYRVHKVLGTLGPKLYFLRLHDKTKQDDVYINEMKQDSFNENIITIQKLVNDYLMWFERYPNAEVENELIKVAWDSDRDEGETLRIIVKLGKLLSYLRGVIPTWETRDSQGIDYAYAIATKENPDRAMIQLRNLARGHALVEGRNYITLRDIKLLIEVILVIFVINYVILAAVTAALSSIGFMLSTQSVYAIPVFCIACGASELAPGQEFNNDLKADSAKDFAPGQEAEQHCIGCVKELTPGQEGLEAGIIGPPKKIQ